MRRKGNLQLEEPNASGASTSASTSVSEPPPSPHQAYFDKYPKRAERIRERNNSNSNSSSKEDKDKHVTIEFPTMQDRKSSWSRQAGGDCGTGESFRRTWSQRSRNGRTGSEIQTTWLLFPSLLLLLPLPLSTTTLVPTTLSAIRLVLPTTTFPQSICRFWLSFLSHFFCRHTHFVGCDRARSAHSPRTPTSPHESVLIASSSVEAMDALIDSMGMGMGSSVSLDTMPFLTPSYARSSRFGYPLYQPPLPTPPEGAKLGIVRGDDATAWKSTKPRGKRPDKSPRRKEWHDDMDDTETEAERRTPSSSTSTPAPPAPVPTSSASSALPTRVKSDEEIEADERADVTSPLVPPTRIRQRSGVSTRSARSARNVAPSVKSGVSGRTLSTSSAGSSVHKARAISRSHAMWDLPNSGDGETESIDAVLSRGERVKERTVVPSIDDIIKMHAPAVVAATKAVSQRSAATPKPPESPTPSKPVEVDDLFDPGHSGLDPTRSSVDSIADEAQRALQAIQDTPLPQSGPSLPADLEPPTRARRRPHPRLVSNTPARLPVPPPPSPHPCPPAYEPPFRTARRSVPETLARPSSSPVPPTQPTHDGNGPVPTLAAPHPPAHPPTTRPRRADRLGCVRYLVALYDEMAEALNLRLICIDRWGLGRTSDVPTDKRGLLEWAGVVEEVADTLGLGRYSVLAHSAGAPYALAGSLKAGERVMGSVHLLAPWVSMAVDGERVWMAGYKWLKYVPNGLIKTAQAAEWRLQGWMIGKPPTIQYEGIGFDASAPMSPGRVSFSSFSEYDELDDFEGRFGSPTRLALGEGKEGGKERGKVNGGGKEKDKDKDKEKTGGNKEKTKKPKDLVVSEMGEYRPRKGSKSIFGGLFNNTAPKSAPKRGQSTPPSAQATIKARGPVELEDPAAEECVEPTTPVPIPPVPPIPPIPDQEQPPESPTTPIPPAPTSAPKLKGLRSMSSLKSRSAKSEPGKHTPSDSDWGSTTRTRGPRRGRPSLRIRIGRGRGARYRSMRDRGSCRPPLRPSLSALPEPGQLEPSPESESGPEPEPKDDHARLGPLASLARRVAQRRNGRPVPVRVWYGDRDDKIGIGSVRWMERVMKSCEVKIVKGAGHSLMTNAEVVVEVLESIAKEWDQ
ncbi:Hydrolase [Rhizoctonia solani]|uniref:Hydrolase n=1 Tax=Rhizoctonia solani TaxID=456999 RepID=A0A8H7M596_9AGAM|nr:Hydrolase [Rhizoctonia solani]